MSASVPRKHRTITKREGRKLASAAYKHKIPTSQWTEDDAVQFFNMDKNKKSVMRTDKDDAKPVMWFLDEENVVQRKELKNV